MAFKRLDPQDFVISADSVTAPLWTNNVYTLTQFYSSSVQAAGSSGQFYLNVYQTESSDSTAEIQFAISYANKYGSGSEWYNDNVDGASPSRTIYGQYRNLVLGDEYSDFIFNGVTSSDFWVISIDRNRYKQSLLPGSLTLGLSYAGDKLSLTDNSQIAPSVIFNDAGRVYQLVSGSAGQVVDIFSNGGYTFNSGSYGWFLPDIATLIINPLATGAPAASGGIALNPNRSSNTLTDNFTRLFDALNNF